MNKTRHGKRGLWLPIGTLSAALIFLGTGCELYYGDIFGSDQDGDSGGGETPLPSPPPTPAPDPSGICSPLPEGDVILDCDLGGGYQVHSWMAEQVGATALHLVGVYQEESGGPGQPNPPGESYLYFDLPGSHVLALSSYEPNHWVVDVAPEAGLEKIVLFGYGAQTATVPSDVIVENYDFESNPGGYPVCGYSLPYNGGGCDTNELIDTVEAVTNLSLSSFHGCYDAGEFQFVTGAPSQDCVGTSDGLPADAIQDCQGGDTYGFRTDDPQDSRLYVGAVYETRSDHSAGNHPMGAADVTFDLPGDNVLVLSAYEPTTWNVSLSAGANLEGIVVFGYHEQVVDAPAGIPIEIHDYEVVGSPLQACGYSLPYNGGGCDTNELIANAEAATGRTLTGFDGCYHATQFAYDPAPE